MIELRDLVKRFDTRDGDRSNAVDRLNLDIQSGQLLTLLGPSGCGKTTTLRMIAGLERPDEGEIRIDGEVVYSATGRVFVGSHKRSVGMVFQSYAIWPHMNVVRNVMFPLIVGKRKMRHRAARKRAIEALDLVGLADFAHRPAPDLSGGQQQRVALARALVREPSVLLLDEPLSNLDAGLRDQMGTELRAVQRRLGVTTVFVTHDQGEALSMSDSVVLMNEGRVVEQGSPEDIYAHPREAFTARFMGVSNVLTGTVNEVNADVADIAVSTGTLRCAIPSSMRGANRVSVYLHPDSFDVATERQGPRSWPGRVQTVSYRGEYCDYELACRDELLRVRLYRHGGRYTVGDEVWVLPNELAALVCDATPSDAGQSQEYDRSGTVVASQS